MGYQLDTYTNRKGQSLVVENSVWDVEEGLLLNLGEGKIVLQAY
jgi:hypothetical protein